MRIFVLFFALMVNVFAASLLSMSVNENSESVEINLSFDAPFEGAIEQNATEKAVVLKISGIAIDSKKDVALSQNPLISRVTMLKDGPTAVQLAFENKKEIGFEALKNNDGYKLQLKITPKAVMPQKSVEANATPMPKPVSTELPKTQTDSEVSWRYIVVVSFLAFLVAVMFYVKKRFANNNGASKGGWLLPKNFTPAKKDDEVNVITQSFLDPNNKLMLVEYNNIRYLLLVGNTNAVVDRYYAEDADLQNDEFRKVMAENERKLSEFLKPQQQLSNFDEYRMKAEGNY
jgi:hypothetical protein